MRVGTSWCLLGLFLSARTTCNHGSQDHSSYPFPFSRRRHGPSAPITLEGRPLRESLRKMPSGTTIRKLPSTIFGVAKPHKRQKTPVPLVITSISSVPPPPPPPRVEATPQTSVSVPLRHKGRFPPFSPFILLRSRPYALYVPGERDALQGD